MTTTIDTLRASCRVVAGPHGFGRFWQPVARDSGGNIAKAWEGMYHHKGYAVQWAAYHLAAEADA